jgi:hydroxyethylthiazole kinase-like uncharacterized protein yjeF
MKIFSSKQLYKADRITTDKQEISSTDLMERAGNRIYNWLHQRMQGAQVPIQIFCGIGNNGGDGLVVGRLLIESGYNVHMYVVNYSDKRSADFLINYDRIKNMTKTWPLLMTSEKDFPVINNEDIIIDAIFGIGLNRCIGGWVKKLIQYLNSQVAFKLAIDMPSGLYANAPLEDAEAVLAANHTLTFQAPKLSFYLPETAKFAPYFEVLDIGLDTEYLQNAEPIAQLISKPEAQKFYKQRQKFDHKGTYGHALIIAGSYGKMGAAVLAAKAAFRAGAGLVTCFIPKCGYEIIQTALPEAMVVTDSNENLISNIDYIIKPSALAVGMGIGTAPETVSALEKLFVREKASMVIDADAINCISENKKLLKILPKNSILTPHLGELKRLIGAWDNDYDRLEKTRKFSKKHKVIVIIKGAHSITVKDDNLYINTTGNPGMATAGSGDVLSGVVAGLLSEGYDPLSAAIFGVYLHGSAGNIVTQSLGFEALMASDINDAIGNAYIELFTQESPQPQNNKEPNDTE